MDRIDLRSDTVTLPSAGMRQAMAAAPVGDDQYGEDPSVNRLQERIAELLGKEAALFVPSGTMANQIGLKVLTRPGDEVIVGDEAHIVWHESGAARGQFGRAVHRGRPRRAVHRRRFPRRLQAAAAISSSRRPPGRDREHAQSRRRRRFPAGRCRRDLRRGARSWGSPAISTARGCSTPRRRRAEPRPSWRSRSTWSRWRCRRGSAARSAACSPAGRPISPAPCGARRMFGGAMRQSGILAAAGLYALDHNLARLAEDHANARLIAERLAGLRGVDLDLATVQTNIVIFHMAEDAPDAATIVARAKEPGVLVSALGARTVRAVTHLDVEPRPMPARRRRARRSHRAGLRLRGCVCAADISVRRSAPARPSGCAR